MYKISTIFSFGPIACAVSNNMLVKQEANLKRDLNNMFYFRNNYSKFAQHLLYNGHAVGPIENIMDILYIMNWFSLRMTCCSRKLLI
jgi:hypothetical protein